MAIQQHPLPQDISNYRFRLIGDMTIKQFASLGISIVLAIVVYSLPLPFFFKYPLSFIFVVLGVGMAFVPVQGRSLDIWIIAFIKSIYSPTQYSWKKTPLAPSESSATTNASENLTTPPVSSARIELTQIKPPISTLPVQDNTVIEPVAATPPEPQPPIPAETPVTPIAAPEPTPTPPPVIPAPATPPVVTATTPPTTPSQLPIPFTPTTPNTLVGLTITPDSRILDGVMVEIKKNGLTLRATKSNKLGQFMFARPLENGIFQILAEKDGFQFAPYSLELKGEIVRPLKIQAAT